MSWHSLAARLLLASGLLLPLFLAVTGVGLERSFRSAIRAGELEKLRLQSYLLLGAAELEGSRLVLPDALSEPRYTQIGSGLYGRFEDASGETVWTSPSAGVVRLPATGAPLGTGSSEFGEARIDDLAHFEYRYGFAWETPEGAPVRFQLTLWHDQSEYQATLDGYRRSLLGWLGLAAAVLLALQLAILRWGLQPLRGLTADLEDVERGRLEQLGGRYPAEVQGVTDRLNQLLASERGRRERYRNTLTDLAHSLKTPLAVLRGALEPGVRTDDLRDLCEEQLGRMEDIVSHQLGRAAGQGSSSLVGKTSVAEVVVRLSKVLTKIYRDKPVEILSEIPPDLYFRGDENDLLEMLGNLLDNACKYARGSVHVGAEREGDRLRLRVSDDGPGIPDGERARILQRGMRADQRESGQGIGLSVVLDIATSYRGTLEIGAADQGGACFSLTLPGGCATQT